MGDIDSLLKELDDIPPNSPQPRPPRSSSVSSPNLRASSSSPQCDMPTGQAQTLFKTSPSVAQRSNVNGHRPQRPPARDEFSAVDDLLQDLDLGDNNLPATGSLGSRNVAQHSSGLPKTLSSNPSRPRSSSVLQKCPTLFLGDANRDRGHSTSGGGSNVCCDNIRCTKCDFKVLQFPRVEWVPSVDYLFFRNCYPTDSSLRVKTTPNHNSCAYCCQCSWESAVAPLRIDFSSDLRWVCAGHSARQS